MPAGESESRTGRLEREGRAYGHVHCAGERVLVRGSDDEAPRELDLNPFERFQLSRGELAVDGHALTVAWLDGEDAERATAERFPPAPTLAKQSMNALIGLIVTIDAAAAITVLVWWLIAGDPPVFVLGVAVVASVLAIPISWIEKRNRDESLER